MNLTNLSVSRRIAAKPEAVFDEWTDPRSPGGPWFGAARLAIDVKVDGLFYFSVKHGGRIWPHYGRFIKIERPNLVEYSWMSESTRGIESVVRVTFDAVGDETDVTLRHLGLPDDALGRSHAEGWMWILDVLETRFSGRAPVTRS